MTSNLLGAARVALVLLALTPVVVDNGVLFPFVTAKALVVRGLVALAGVLVCVATLRSPEFRADLSAKVASFGRSPLALSVLAWLAAMIVSTLGATNAERAFYGDVERGEGLIGTLPFVGFFFLAAILFTRKDWVRFFRLTLVVSVVLFVHALWQWRHGQVRPGSLTGHPAYLGPYCFFVMASAVLVVADARTLGGKALAFGAIPLSFATMLLSQTRAALLGFAVGVVAVLVLLAVRGQGLGDGASTPRFLDQRVRKLAIGLLGVLVLASTVFFATRRAAVWQSIPGVRRVAAYTADDPTTRWRLAVWQADVQAMSPAASGWRRIWTGWGPENLQVPFNKHYDPPRHLYDPEWYDRSHNKLLDVVLMTGVVGLVTHIALWVAFFAAALARSRPLHEQATLLFAGLAYFVQNLVSFDSLTTYVPWFGLLAFAALPSVLPRTAPGSRASRSAGVAAVAAFAMFSAFSLVAHTIPAYRQLRHYVTLYRRTLDAQTLLSEWTTIRSTYTYAQVAIRTDFLPNARRLLRSDRGNEPILAAAIVAMDEVMQRDSPDPRHLLSLGEATDEYADITGRPELHRTAEGHLRRALSMAPGRRHIHHALGLNQSRVRCSANAAVCYYRVLADMVAARNRDGARLARERLELLDPPRRELLAALNRRVEEGKWDSIQISVSGESVNVRLAPDAP